MPRPKGSKNKKKLQPAAQIAAQIAARQEVKLTLEADVAAVLADIEGKKELLKGKRKEIRNIEKDILALEAKKAEAEAIETAAAQKEEIQSIVTKLISSGKTAGEILELLNK